MIRVLVLTKVPHLGLLVESDIIQGICYMGKM